jgi:archaellum biogenesis ATPase FlaH
MLDTKQQEMLISLWVADAKLFTKTLPIIQPEYFDPQFRKAITFIKEYHEKYNGIPALDILETETKTKLKKVKSLESDQLKYTQDQIETFCRQSALRNIILEQSPSLIMSEQYDQLEHLVRTAISIKVDSNIGISFFENPEARQGATENAVRYSTGYPELDKRMDGGIARGEMMLVLAISGGGKSVSILNFGLNMLKERGLNGKFLNALYVSLELSEEMIDKRAQMVVSGKSSLELSRHPDIAAAALNGLAGNCGEMVIKKVRLGSTANDIRALIKEIEIQKGWIPDIIVLDYLDKMYPIQKVSTENIGTRDKFITEEFYDLLGEYNMIGLTASQLTKGAADVEVYTQSHQAGGAEKIRSSDWTLAIHLTDAMRAAGQIGFQFLKTRSSGGVGSIVNIGWDAKSLRITNGNQKGAYGQQQRGAAPTSKASLDDLLGMT